MAFFNRSSKAQAPEKELPPAKRISTPAGQRLSVIMENGDNISKSKAPYRTSVRKSALSGLDAPRESMEDQSHSSYSYSVWSDGEKFSALRNNKHVAKRGGWKRVALILLIIIAAIVALAVGLALGLKKKSSHASSSPTSSQSPAESAQAPGGAGTGVNAAPTKTASLSPTSTPSNFPVGKYSMVTFLDTVQTNCTSNPSTWTCYPYTIYNSSPDKSQAIFNWVITSPSAGTYAISSTDNPFSISFTNTPLELLDKGLDTERYRFQLQETKTVSPSADISGDDSASTCYFNATTVQAYLYTKMAKSYPDTSAGQSSGDPSFPVWPFAVRVEQAVGGGQDVPNCYKSDGSHITDGIEAQDQGSLCSCLYKNWRTPGTY